MEIILKKAENYKKQGLSSIEASVKIFHELKTVRFSDIRILVDITYL